MANLTVSQIQEIVRGILNQYGTMDYSAFQTECMRQGCDCQTGGGSAVTEGVAAFEQAISDMVSKKQIQLSYSPGARRTVTHISLLL